MSFTLGHAVRRRAGLPSTPLALMQPPEPVTSDVNPCHVKGCGAPLRSPNGRAGDEYYLHMLANHPRSTSAEAARNYFRDKERR